MRLFKYMISKECVCVCVFNNIDAARKRVSALYIVHTVNGETCVLCYNPDISSVATSRLRVKSDGFLC